MRKPTKITPKSSNHHHLETAYDLVITDLFHSLKKLADGESIKLGDLGTFHKKQYKMKSALNNRTYLYYRISFKASRTLKKELDK
jgi:nucleoid DNA-binding protein